MAAALRQPRPSPRPVPTPVGIGLRTAHEEAFLRELPPVGWIEVHSENYFHASAPRQRALERAREHYPLSLHGVGLSLGSTDPLSLDHVAQLRKLADRLEPMLVSEHLSWGSVNGAWFNDLLPLPYTREALRHMISRVSAVQELLRRKILIENPSSYLAFNCSEMTEREFLVELARCSGCGILLDINNVYVSARNHGFDPLDYLAHIPPDLVHEVHLAGHSARAFDGREILIDTHSTRVADPVWDLYRAACMRLGAVATLIEWDADLPDLEVLIGEALKADRLCRESARALVA